MCCLYPENRASIMTSASPWFQKSMCLRRLLLFPTAAELTLCAEWRNGVSWKLLNATEHGPRDDPRNSQRNLHFEMTGNGSAMWQDTAIRGPGSSQTRGALLSLCILPPVPPSWLKKLTAVLNAFRSGTHCCPRGRAGCCLCAGPRWTCSRALICPPSSPRCFPRFQSQTWNKREMPGETKRFTFTQTPGCA